MRSPPQCLAHRKGPTRVSSCCPASVFAPAVPARNALPLPACTWRSLGPCLEPETDHSSPLCLACAQGTAFLQVSAACRSPVRDNANCLAVPLGSGLSLSPPHLTPHWHGTRAQQILDQLVGEIQKWASRADDGLRPQPTAGWIASLSSPSRRLGRRWHWSQNARRQCSERDQLLSTHRADRENAEGAF